MNSNVYRTTLAGSMFIMGACGLIYEYVLSVLGNYLIGSSHEEIFIIIGLMMFAMGVGSYAQQNLQKNIVDRFLYIEMILGLVGGFAATCVYGVFSISESYRVVLYGFAFAIGFLIGMEIPILIRINERYSKSLRVNLSQILSMDYVGALAGALLFTYVLLSKIDLARICYILGITNLVVGIIGLICFRKFVQAPKRIALFAVICMAALIYGSIMAPHWQKNAEQRYFQDPVVYSSTSKYQHIVITKMKERVRLYLNGHVQFSSLDEHIYHEMLVHSTLALSPDAKDVLVLGGGDGLAVRELLKYETIKSISLVELDPEIIQLAQSHEDLKQLNQDSLGNAKVAVFDSQALSQGALEDVHIRSERDTHQYSHEEKEENGDSQPNKLVAKVHAMLIDADLFLRAAPKKYDAVIIDFPDPSRIEVAKLYSREFYKLLATKLKPGASICVQSTSPYHAKKVFLCIGETIRSAGYSAVPLHQNVPTFGEWGFHVAQLGKGHEDRMRNELRSLKKLNVSTRFLDKNVLAASTYFGKDWLDTSEEILPNSKFTPSILTYFKEAWKNI